MLSESWRPSLKRTHTNTYCRVCLYLSQLFTHRRQQRKKGSEQNREGQKQKGKERKVAEKKREMELKGLLKKMDKGKQMVDAEESGQS